MVDVNRGVLGSALEGDCNGVSFEPKVNEFPSLALQLLYVRVAGLPRGRQCYRMALLGNTYSDYCACLGMITDEQ